MAWAVARAGGHLRANPASPDRAVFEQDDFDELLDEVRRWARVRDPQLLRPETLLDRVVGGLFGVRVDGPGGRMEVAPFLPEGWRSFGLRRLRCHRTLIDLEIRPRVEWVTLRLAVTFGPPLAAAVSLPDFAVGGVTVDDTPLESVRAVFTAHDEHEVVFYVG